MDENALRETKIKGETIYDGRVVHLEKWTVRLPDGREATREIIKHVGAVAVVACDAQGNLYMVRQWRAALEKTLLEIPAGKLDAKTEDHLEAAQRELKEETGLTARRWMKMADVVSTPGYCDEIITLYLATDLTAGETHFDADEFLHISRMPAPALYKMVYAGEIEDGKSVAALLLAKPLLEQMGVRTED